MIYTNDYILKYDIVGYTINELSKQKVYFTKSWYIEKDTNRPVYLWQNTAALYAYFCYILTVECEKNGLNIYKGLDKIDTQRFSFFVPVNEYLADIKTGTAKQNNSIDRKTMTRIKNEIGNKPKGSINLNKIIKEIIQKFFIER